MRKDLGFELPDYIEQELNEYILLIQSKKGVSAKWQNIRILLRVAVLNNKLTYEQIKSIEKMYGEQCK